MAYSRIYRSIFTGRPASALLRSQNVNSTLCKQIPQFSRGFRATNASQQRYRQYSRFQQSRNFLYRWSQSPNFYYQVGGGGLAIGSVYVYNLEDVPVSGRRRFNFIRPEWEKSFGEEMYNQAIQENRGKILSEWDPRTRMVQRVLDRLIPSSGIDGEQWEVHVVKDEEPNAFVIPGGKVFVNTGILRICKNDDGLATVLGHEIAHNVAHHAAERMSQAGILTLLGLVLYATLQIDVGVFRLLGSFVFEMPGSRKQEAEADYIGLMMMASSCYDPDAAVGLWGRMEQEEEVKVPQFMSTHPSSHNRMEKMREWLPEAHEKRNDAQCGITTGYADDFRRAFQDRVTMV